MADSREKLKFIRQNSIQPIPIYFQWLNLSFVPGTVLGTGDMALALLWVGLVS